MDTPQPEIIYDKNPPTAVRQMKIEDVPIASIIENPKSAVNMAIRNIPPPTPKRPDENPTKRPMIPHVPRLNGILASSLSLLMLMTLLTVMNKSRHPKINSNTLEGSADATKPPKSPPITPKMPNLIPGPMILSIVRVCLYAPLSEVGIIIARLVPNDINIAKSGSTPMYLSKKYCRGTIKNPPPTPRSPEAKPAQIPIKIKPMKYSIGNITIKILYAYYKYYLSFVLKFHANKQF